MASTEVERRISVKRMSPEETNERRELFKVFLGGIPRTVEEEELFSGNLITHACTCGQLRNSVRMFLCTIRHTSFSPLSFTYKQGFLDHATNRAKKYAYRWIVVL